MENTTPEIPSLDKFKLVSTSRVQPWFVYAIIGFAIGAGAVMGYANKSGEFDKSQAAGVSPYTCPSTGNEYTLPAISRSAGNTAENTFTRNDFGKYRSYYAIVNDTAASDDDKARRIKALEPGTFDTDRGEWQAVVAAVQNTRARAEKLCNDSVGAAAKAAAGKGTDNNGKEIDIAPVPTPPACAAPAANHSACVLTPAKDPNPSNGPCSSTPKETLEDPSVLSTGGSQGFVTNGKKYFFRAVSSAPAYTKTYACVGGSPITGGSTNNPGSTSTPGTPPTPPAPPAGGQGGSPTTGDSCNFTQDEVGRLIEQNTKDDTTNMAAVKNALASVCPVFKTCTPKSLGTCKYTAPKNNTIEALMKSCACVAGDSCALTTPEKQQVTASVNNVLKTNKTTAEKSSQLFTIAQGVCQPKGARCTVGTQSISSLSTLKLATDALLAKLCVASSTTSDRY